MVKVAVAGGTSPTLGRSIVEALVATKGKHDVVILSRAKSPSNSGKATGDTKYGAPVISVNYDDETAVKKVLKDNNIHTLISVMRLDDVAAMVTVHATMLAAAQAAGVNRYIMSDWSMGPLAANTVDVLAHKNELHNLGQKHMEDAKTKGEHVVECSTIQNGGFMEYFTQGAPGNWFDDPFYADYIDVTKGRFVEPCTEDGEPAPHTCTSLKDIGKFVAAAMDLGSGKLVGRVGLSGQLVTGYQFVADILKKECGREVKVERITPKDCDRLIEENDAKFQQAMSKGEFDLQSFMVKATAQMVKVNCEGRKGGAVVEGKLNELCPQVKPVQVNELVLSAWK